MSKHRLAFALARQNQRINELDAIATDPSRPLSVRLAAAFEADTRRRQLQELRQDMRAERPA